jgi:hypothetical protein
MNAQFFTHDLPHLMGYYATHPIALFLNPLAALQIRAIARLVSDSLRLTRAFQNSALGCVQLPVLGSTLRIAKYERATSTPGGCFANPRDTWVAVSGPVH